MHDLTDKQQRFCEEYVVDLNATQAAIRAGYSANTAEAQASRLLRNVKVQAYVAQLQEATSKRLAFDAEYVVRGLMREAEDMELGSGSSRVSALEKLGKHLGMFTDKVEQKSENVTRIERVIISR